MSALFPLGQIVATPGALAALERAKQPATCFLARHESGTGRTRPHRYRRKQLLPGSRISFAEPLPDGCRRTLWVFTEADRSATTLLLPEEY